MLSAVVHASRLSGVCALRTSRNRCALISPLSCQVSPSTRSCSSKVPQTKKTSDSSVSQEVKPLSNIPIIKELFLGRLDRECLEYPELETIGEVEELNQLYEPIYKFMTEGIDSDKIDRDAKIPPETLQLVKDLGLFGQQIPEEYGGLGLSSTKFARLAEATALDGSISVTLAAHQSIGLKGIIIAGTEEQKLKYLPKLATGEHVAAFCLTEPGSGSDAQSIQTRAVLSADGKHFHINGSKVWISNGGFADIMTVFAKTNLGTAENPDEKITAFIVERKFGGVSSGKPEDKLGIRGSNTSEVFFDNTPVPIENVIGDVGGGFKIAMLILNSGRFSMGAAGAGIMRFLLVQATEHVMTRKQFGKAIGEFDLIKEKLARMAVDAYVMESMAYLTAGLLDRYEKSDLSLEAAVVKVYSSEAMCSAVNELLQIMGGQGFMRDYPFERYVRDARILPIFEGTNEILRLFIAGTALQYAGRELADLVRKLRQPLKNIGLIFSEMQKGKTQSELEQVFASNLHPNLMPLYKEQASLIAQLKKVVRGVLKDYGKNVMDEQMIVKRLADIAIDMYAVTACFSRYSRSQCIGVPNADHEFDIVHALCRTAFPRIKSNIDDIANKQTRTPDEYYKRIVDELYKHKGYAANHPLHRTW